MTVETEAPKDKDKAPAGDAIVTERGKRFEEDTDATVSLGSHRGRHEGTGSGSDDDGDAERGEDSKGDAEDAELKRLRLSNTHAGHVLTHLRRLHANTEEGGTITREQLREVLEMAEAVHRNPTPQPESGSVVHGTAGPGAPPDIHHTPFSHTERHRIPGQ